MPKPQVKVGTMLDLLQKNPEATQADLAELEAATQPRRPPVIRASTLSERIRDKYYDLFESAARQPIGRIADALGLSDLQGIANERATGGKLMRATAVPPPGGSKIATKAEMLKSLASKKVYNPVAVAPNVMRHKGVEMVSVEDLKKFRNEDRRVQFKSKENITEPTQTLLPRLTEELRQGGAIQEPLVFAYDPKGSGILHDGNTRLAAIEDAGFTHAPVYVLRNQLHGWGKQMQILSEEEILSPENINWLLPSKLGFNTVKLVPTPKG